jgi:hypothetical protein
MEKLIELLNEYEKENWRHFQVTEIWMGYRNNDLMVISKRYWIIKRLVNNNKIDNSKLSRESDMWFGDKYYREESLLMLLAISENPIEDLISYLK